MKSSLPLGFPTEHLIFVSQLPAIKNTNRDLPIPPRIGAHVVLSNLLKRTI